MKLEGVPSQASAQASRQQADDAEKTATSASSSHKPAAKATEPPQDPSPTTASQEPRSNEEPVLEGLLRNPRYKLSFRVDEATKDVVVSVIDPETKDVIRQFPPEELLRLAERLKSTRGNLVSSQA